MWTTLLLCAALQAPAARKDYIDVHLHLWWNEGPWAQERDGGTPERPAKRPGGKQGKTQQPQSREGYETSARRLLAQMDRAGVKQAVIMTLQQDQQLFEAVLKLAKDHPGRFAPAAGGDVLQPMIETTDAGAVTPELKRRFEQEARALVARGIRAFGEMISLHFSMTAKHGFIQVPPDHPLFLTLADVAADGDVAIDLHMEAVTKDGPVPEGLPEKNKGPVKATIPPFERLLAHNRKARIVWQHIGWDNTGEMTTELLRRLLKEHANLFLALRVEERTRRIGTGAPMPNRIVDPQGKVRPEWLALLQEFPDRCVIGSDEFFGTSDDPKASPQSFEETWRILDQLPAELAAKVGRENAVRVYRLK